MSQLPTTFPPQLLLPPHWLPVPSPPQPSSSGALATAAIMIVTPLERNIDKLIFFSPCSRFRRPPRTARRAPVSGCCVFNTRSGDTRLGWHRILVVSTPHPSRQATVAIDLPSAARGHGGQAPRADTGDCQGVAAVLCPRAKIVWRSRSGVKG